MPFDAMGKRRPSGSRRDFHLGLALSMVSHLEFAPSAAVTIESHTAMQVGAMALKNSWLASERKM